MLLSYHVGVVQATTGMMLIFQFKTSEISDVMYLSIQIKKCSTLQLSICCQCHPVETPRNIASLKYYRPSKASRNTSSRVTSLSVLLVIKRRRAFTTFLLFLFSKLAVPTVSPLTGLNRLKTSRSHTVQAFLINRFQSFKTIIKLVEPSVETVRIRLWHFQ